MQPEISINYFAVIAATIAQFLIGWIWYTFLFGKIWATEMGIKMDNPPPSSTMIRGMILSLFGNLLTAYIPAHVINVWRGSVWGLGPDGPFYYYGFFGAFFTWIGFYIPQELSGVAWQNKSWKLFAINTSSHLLSLTAASTIVAGWR